VKPETPAAVEKQKLSKEDKDRIKARNDEYLRQLAAKRQ
jgi:hypothetical protein